MRVLGCILSTRPPATTSTGRAIGTVAGPLALYHIRITPGHNRRTGQRVIRLIDESTRQPSRSIPVAASRDRAALVARQLAARSVY